MLIILNSCVMLEDGIYTKKTISNQDARKLFNQYRNDYISYIGYPNSCKILSELFDTQIALNRDRTKIKNGDIILAISLNYRVLDPCPKSTRRHGDSLDDYNFAKITFELEE